MGLSGSRLVVAVSGGQDSFALLDALCSLRESCNLTLICAHFNHALRGEESQGDARFVSEHCGRVGIEFVLGSVDSGETIRGEEEARNARYGFLAEVAFNEGADAVAVGHSATDQAETVLLNVVRGTGLSGLAAMREDSERNFRGRNLRIVRPLLKIPRPVLTEYCRSRNLSPRFDSSNDSDEFARNRVRRSVLPLLRTFNPAVETSLVRLAENAVRAVDFLEGEVLRLWPKLTSESDGAVSISRTVATLHPTLAAEIARRALGVAKGDLRDVQQEHVDGIVGLLSGGRGRSIDLPGGLVARARGEKVTIGPFRALSHVNPQERIRLDVPGDVHWSGWAINASIEVADHGGSASRDRLTARLDPALAEDALWVRGWQNGDRIEPAGMTGTRKLQDLFVDEKVPREERRTLPLIVSDRGIAWVAGQREAGWAKVAVDSEKWLRVRAEPSRSGPPTSPG